MIVAETNTQSSGSQQQWLEAVLDVMPTPFLLIEPGTARVLFANKAADMLAGGTFPKDAPAEEYHTVYYCTDAQGKRIPNHEMPGVRAAHGERLSNFEMDWYTPGGKRSLIVQSETLAAMHGHEATIVLSFQDVTALKQAEVLSSRLGRILDQSVNEIYIFDANTLRCLQANQGALHNLGYTAAEIVSCTPRDLLVDYDHQQLERTVASLRSREHEQIVFEAVLRRKDNTHYPVEVRLQLSHAEQPPVLVAVCLDVSARRASEHALRESEARFWTMADNAPISLWVSDTSGLVTYFNQRWLQFTGRTLEQEVGEGWLQGVHPDDLEQNLSLYQTAFDARQDFIMEYRLRRADGVYRWILDTGSPRFAPDGAFVGFIGSCIDISERKDVEQAALEARALLDSLFNAAPVALGFIDRDFRFVRVNDALAAIHGMPAEQEVGRTIYEALPALAPKLEQLIKQVLTTREPIQGLEVSGEIPATPGQIRHWLANYYPVQSGNDAMLGVGVAAIEVTERKRNEERQHFVAEASEILVSSLDYETTLHNVAKLAIPRLADWCAVDVLDENGALRRLAVTHIDPAKIEMAHELQRRYPTDLEASSGIAYVLRTGRSELTPEIPDALLARSIKDPERLAMLRSLGLKSSMIVPLVTGGRVLGTLSLLSAESGRRFDTADLALAEDIGRRAAIAVDNARLYRDAQEAVMARDDFLSIASHELKTPITALQLQAQGLLRLAQKGTLATLAPERIVTKIELINQQTARLTNLATDLLDVARIRAGRFDLRMEEIDLVEVVRDVASRFDDQLASAECSMEIEADAPVRLWSDRARLEQVITNLLSNALKYGRGKPIMIHVAYEANTARLQVRDQGIGIAAEHLDRIFVRFERAVSSRNFGGLGLGLYIVRQIVEALGGIVRVSSEVGVGSTFTVTLPRAITQD